MPAGIYTFPSKGLGVENEIPGSIQIIARNVEFGMTSTVKRPSTLRGGSSVGTENITTKPDRIKTEAYINLPMPQNLLYAQSASYNQGQTVGASLATTATALQESALDDTLGNKATNIIGGVISDIAREFASTPLQLSKGIVANPFTFTLFGKMEHRTFNYSWVFLPRNEIESQEIKAICDALSYYQLPGRNDSSFLQMLDIPLHFDIKYLWGNSLNRYLEQPRRCVLTNINVNYGGATRAQRHIDGAPIEVGLDLTFIEVEPLIRNKIGTSGSTITGGDKFNPDAMAEAKTKLGNLNRKVVNSEMGDQDV